MKELYIMVGIDVDCETVTAIGTASTMFLVVLDWFRREVIIMEMRPYSPNELSQYKRLFP